MTNEIINELLKENIGKEVLLFLKNSFRYSGKIINYDNKFLEIFDYKSSKIKIILIEEIKELEMSK